ncbi:hypothetical protein Taro_016804, partial [Colocasia esculenta]|nr:hypothetical protein [Colocasia esculenta]
MLDPGIKHEPSYFVYDSGSENDVWILKEDGKPFIGEVWPGPYVFPDYTRQQTRSWWGKLVKDFVSNGVMPRIGTTAMNKSTNPLKLILSIKSPTWVGNGSGDVLYLVKRLNLKVIFRLWAGISSVNSRGI